MNKQAINAALCAKSPGERESIAEQYGIAKEDVLKFWNSGRICGQCKHYHPLADNTALNGTCAKVLKRDFTKPSDLACKVFER